MRSNNFIKSLILCISLLASLSSFAGTRVALGGGTVQPSYGELHISLNALRQDVAYSITCTISSTGATKAHFSIDGAVFSYAQIYSQLNGVQLPSSLAITGVNGNINLGENTLVIPRFARDGQFSNASPVYLRILNLDDTVIETVHDCYADIS